MTDSVVPFRKRFLYVPLLAGVLMGVVLDGLGLLLAKEEGGEGFKAQNGLDESMSPRFSWRQQTNDVFDVGETFLYVVKYGIIPAGFATLEVQDVVDVEGRRAYYIMSRAKTNKATDLIFKVRDKNQSFMDVKSLCSLGFVQQIREGLYRRVTHTRYDHPNSRFVYKKIRQDKEYVVEGGIPPFVQDVLSSLYYVRTRDLDVGKEFTFDANSGGKTWPLVVKVKRRKNIRVPAGKFECFHIEPILAGEGIFQQKGRLEVFVTADERRIPVLLRSRVLVGAFDAELTEFSLGGNAGFLDEKGLNEIDDDTEPERDDEGT